jgi:hypothetical protein
MRLDPAIVHFNQKKPAHKLVVESCVFLIFRYGLLSLLLFPLGASAGTELRILVENDPEFYKSPIWDKTITNIPPSTTPMKSSAKDGWGYLWGATLLCHRADPQADPSDPLKCQQRPAPPVDRIKMTTKSCLRCGDDWFRISNVDWPILVFRTKKYVFPTGDYSVEQRQGFGLPNLVFTEVGYNEQFVRDHEGKHVHQITELFLKHTRLLRTWANEVVSKLKWFPSKIQAETALINDFRENFNKSWESFRAEYSQMIINSGHGKDDESSVSILFAPADQQTPLDQINERTPMKITLLDKDDSWSSRVDAKIDMYTPTYQLNTTFGQDLPVEPECVPAPLPVLGVGIFLRFARKLRHMSKSLSPQLNSLT